MNDNELTQLKILVERVVRPVSASVGYMGNMREELLAHVSAVYLEEIGKLGDERAALERTAQRFGQPAELAGQLQQAVPRRDLVSRLAEEWLGPGKGRSTWRRSIRHALVATLMCGGAWGMILILASLLLVERLRTWHGLAAPLSGIAGLCVFVAGLLFLCHWMHDALYGPAGRSWLRAVLTAAASGLLMPAVTFAVLLLWSGDVGSSLRDVFVVTPLAMALTPVVVGCMAWRLSIEIRALEEWASLTID